jgi:hypothetical protein
MKLFTWLVLAFLAGGLWIGCSDSTPATINYPLKLTIVSDTIDFVSAVFDFQVTQNGVPLEGAELYQTDDPSGVIFPVGITSDTGGHFPPVMAVVSDTLSEVAYQAVSGTLTSNYITWSP